MTIVFIIFGLYILYVIGSAISSIDGSSSKSTKGESKFRKYQNKYIRDNDLFCSNRKINLKEYQHDLRVRLSNCQLMEAEITVLIFYQCWMFDSIDVDIISNYALNKLERHTSFFEQGETKINPMFGIRAWRNYLQSQYPFIPYDNFKMWLDDGEAIASNYKSKLRNLSSWRELFDNDPSGLKKLEAFGISKRTDFKKYTREEVLFALGGESKVNVKRMIIVDSILIFKYEWYKDEAFEFSMIDN